MNMDLKWAFCHSLVGEMPQAKKLELLLKSLRRPVTRVSEARHQGNVMCEIPGELGWNARFSPNPRYVHLRFVRYVSTYLLFTEVTLCGAERAFVTPYWGKLWHKTSGKLATNCGAPSLQSRPVWFS